MSLNLRRIFENIYYDCHTLGNYTTDGPFSVEYKPLNIAVNIQSVLTGNYTYHSMSIPNIWCDVWYKSKTTWLMDKNAISHSVDMAKGCHSAYGLVTSLCHIHLMGYCIFVHQPCGLAISYYHGPTKILVNISTVMGSHEYSYVIRTNCIRMFNRAFKI